MKKLIPLLLITLCLSVKSQISYQGLIPDYGMIEPFTTTSLGTKFLNVIQNQYIGLDTTGIPYDTLVVYNTDFSIYKTIVPPQGYLYNDFYNLSSLGGGFPSISDQLFNSDTLLEFIVTKYNNSSENIVSVMNELGQIIYTFPDTISNGNIHLYSIGGVFSVWYSTLPHPTGKFYSLPGTLPCNQCNYTTGIVEPSQGSGLSGLNVYPNPFNNSLQIEYSFSTLQLNPRIIISDILGRELKTIPLVNQSDKLLLNTTDLSKGTLIISLFGSSETPISKKVIKID